MLVGLKDILPVLEQKKLCLAAFDIAGGQSDFVLGVLGACEAAKCPAMFLVWAPGATYIGMEACVDLVRSVAGRSSVPVVLHLDHGYDEATVEKGLKLGFKSVMYDGSRFGLDENIRRTRAVVEMARTFGATTEGELGSMGNEHGEQSQDGVLTDPAQAVRFVRETGVDLFAPSIGNAHGFYKQPPKLRFDLIETIRRDAGVPLSMHGGTGIPMGDVRRAAELGVRKMNVATLLHKQYTDAVRQAAREDGPKAPRWTDILLAGRKAVSATVSEYLRELHLEGLL